MSNNNPHSHINQTAQNSWNPLQIPSYIPRQPQLAHMSNERPMVRSPLAWHAAAPPPESLYNFMSAANHKNLEHSMNPLLPPYVRGPPPFDSMDLSLQSNRSAASPLNKSAHSLLPVPLPPQLDYGHKMQTQQQQQHNLQQQQQMHAPNNYPIHNLSTNSPQSQQHSNSGMPNVSTASATSTPSSPAQNSSKFLSSNGSDCEQPASLIQPAQNQSIAANNGSNYMRENFAKMTHINRAFENDSHSKALQKPIELVNKDCNYSGILPSKMPASLLQQQQQQRTSKKHSPLRSGNNSGYHVSQAQQPQQSPFNSPAATIKHNGPHTPPTPQSPSMHQTQQQQQQISNSGNNVAQQQQQQQQLHQSMLHSGNNNANLLDYNQLHLQQHNNYQQSQHLQQQHLHHIYPPQQQQPPPPPHHHQHWQQQHMSQHPSMLTQSPMQPPPFDSPLHSQQQKQNTLANLEPASPATPTYTLNSEPNFEQRNLEHQQHPNAAAGPINSPTNRAHRNIPDSAESPTTNASSNDDDSNGGGIGTKLSSPSPLQPSTSSKSKKSNSNSPVSNKNSPLSNRPQLLVDSPIGGQCISPKNSPTMHHRKSPRKAEIHSPESLDLSSKNVASPANLIAAQSPQQQRTLTPQRSATATTPTALNAEESNSQSANGVVEKLKNGHTPPQSNAINANEPPENEEIETIDKIAEMIAKTTSNSSSQHSRHSHCSNSNDVHSNASSKSTRTELCESPKTKKQRQALKLRNAEQNMQDWSTNSYNDATTGVATASTSPKAKATVSSPLVSNDNDNAVLAEELRKPPTSQSSQHPSAVSPHKQQTPLSPQSNSRSSSSSSSSSSCSNSTRSSYGNRMQKPKESENAVIELEGQSEVNLVKANLGDVSKKTTEKDVNQLPLDLNCKANCTTTTTAAAAAETQPLPTAATPSSPDKSKFEEVENKLEEMFAGIEDEPILIDDDDKLESDSIKRPASDQIATDLSVVLELSNSLSDVPTNVLDAQPPQQTVTARPAANLLTSATLPTTVPIQTKAAKKSTVPSPVKPPSPPSALLTTTKASANNTTDAKAVTARKTLPRRRLSMALDPANLRIMLEGNESDTPKTERVSQPSNNEVICILDDERPSTSAAAAAAAAAANALANTSNDDCNKHIKNRNNNNSKGKSNSNKTANSGKGNTNSTGGGEKSTAAKTTTKRSKANQQTKQTQQKRRKQSSSEDESPPTTSGRDINTSTAASATTATITEKYKSPFILIKRDGSVSVVNAATAEDIANDKQAKGKKPQITYAHHERRNIRGFHSSTLSQKYDADTTDSTWVCVFCKRGPHRMGLGDLFGPYLVTIDCEEYKNATNAPDAQNIDEEFVNKRKRIDMVQLSPRGPPIVLVTKAQEALNAIVGGNSRMNKKKKKSIDELPPAAIAAAAATPTMSSDPLDVSLETFNGMNKVSERSYEVWLHEDCSVWAPDVYLVGARIMGLDVAVWNSTRYQCVICAKSGATVCCLQRDCKAAAHIPCARESLWSLNESDWHVHCQRHTDKNFGNISTTSTQNIQQNINKQQICTTPNQQQTKNS